MRLITCFFILIFSFNILAAPCDGAAGKNHTNPNGSIGGFVANTATVSRTVTIDTLSEVCDLAKISGNAQIKGKTEILGSTEISGNAIVADSRLYSAPKILGSSVIIKSIVCQASVITSLRVIESNYYCNVDDPEPKDPGEAGIKTLLGIDSDGDGVRDDIEIYLNRVLSNTKNKDNSADLLASKALAKNMSDSVKLIKNKEILVEKWRERINILSCNSFTGYDDFLELYLNTKERIMAWIEIDDASNGEANDNKNRSCVNFNFGLGIVRGK